jgi:ribose-phosphate pyrophosphokinase
VALGFQQSEILFVKIFSGTSNPLLARKIAESIGMELARCAVSSFPDGETFVKIEENVRGEDIFIVQSTCPPTNHNLMELFIMMDAVRRASAMRITAVLPFYGYARQDRKDQPRRQPVGGRRGRPHPDDGFARPANSGLFRHPGGPPLRRAGHV